MATLYELETTWRLDDVERAIAYLDMSNDLQSEVRKSVNNGIKGISN